MWTLAGKNGNDWAMQHLPYPAHTHTKLLNDPLGSRGEKLGEEAVWKIELVYMCCRSRARQMGAT
jgi:hypothetical protein